MAPPEKTDDITPDQSSDYTALEARVQRLEERLAGRSRVLQLAVTVSCCVFSGLLILHWAGHFFRHGN